MGIFSQNSFSIVLAFFWICLWISWYQSFGSKRSSSFWEASFVSLKNYLFVSSLLSAWSISEQGVPPLINHLYPATYMVMIDYSSKLFWRFFWIFFSSDKVLFTLFFIWRFWHFFLRRISSQPYNFVDIYPNPIKLGLEDTLLISSKMMSSDLWLDHVVGPMYLSCTATQGCLAVLFFCSGAKFANCISQPLQLPSSCWVSKIISDYITDSDLLWKFGSTLLFLNTLVILLQSLVAVSVSSSCNFFRWY